MTRSELSGLGESRTQPIDPTPAVQIGHHRDDGRVFEPSGDRRPERGAQHPRAASAGFGSDGLDGGQGQHAMGVEALDVLADGGYFSGEEILGDALLPKPLRSGAKAAGQHRRGDGGDRSARGQPDARRCAR